MIMFKILVLVFRFLQGTAPSYLRSLFNRVPQTYSLRSSDESRFVVPKYRTKLADRSIAVVGPKWWNALPKTSHNIFRSRLKTLYLKCFINDGLVNMTLLM